MGPIAPVLGSATIPQPYMQSPTYGSITAPTYGSVTAPMTGMPGIMPVIMDLPQKLAGLQLRDPQKMIEALVSEEVFNGAQLLNIMADGKLHGKELFGNLQKAG